MNEPAAATGRRALDFYETAPWQTRALLANVPEIGGRIVEPCAGDNSIAKVLTARTSVLHLITNDIDPDKPAHTHLDATGEVFWSTVAGGCDWVVGNFPFEMPACLTMVQHAVRTAKVGVAVMLRISFLEPTDTRHPRGPWLAENPITRLLALPRHSFTGNGKSDNATTAWFIWSRKRLKGRPIVCLYGADVELATIPEIEQEARS